MALVKFVTHDGNEVEANVNTGDSIMTAAIDNGIDAIVAECGGACACATCHCYIDEAWTDKVSPAEEIEKEMLDCALDTKDNSRLSCQVVMTDEMDGIVVHLPEKQY
jgi:2Fe-2S ferredoxin